MVLSFLLVLLLLFCNRRSKRTHDENSEKLVNVTCYRCDGDRFRRCAMNNANCKCESCQDKREIDKLKIETEQLKEEIKQMKKECEEKGHLKCDAIESKTGPFPSLFNESQLPIPSFDVDNPFVDICGIRISLQGHNHPDTETIQHSLPSDLKNFDNLRREGLYFDKTIQIGDVLIRVHKGTSEIISLPNEYDATIIDCIVNYAYSGILMITKDTVQSLMRTAAFLCMEEVVEQCYVFMRKRIEFDDALPLLYFCRSIDYNKRDESLMKFIESNFVPMSRTPEFLSLTFDDLMNIIDRDSINIDDEKQVFDAVDKWIGNDDSRKIFGPRLLKLIHSPCLAPSFLAEIVSKNWIADSPECIDIINEALCIGKNSNIVLKKSRRNSNVHNLIVVTSSNRFDYNEHNNEFSKVDIFDPLKKEWHHGLIECRKLHENAVVVGDEIIFMGYAYKDDSRKEEKGTMIYLNARTNEWHTLSMASLEDQRCGVYGVIDGKIYSAGGEDDYLYPFKTFAPSNPSAGWTKLVNMTECRDGAASCVLDGKLYVIGGYKNESRTAEYYDPATNEWTSIAYLKKDSYRDGAAALNGDIFLVGTVYHGNNKLSSLRKYSPATDEWTELKPMKHPRSSPCVIASGGKLYVCGGWDRAYTKQVPYMEIYDPSTDSWEELEMPEIPNRPVMFSYPIPASLPTPNVEL